MQKQPKSTPKHETILDIIKAGDVERLASFFYGSMARTGGSIMVAPEGIAFDDHTFKRDVLQQRADNEPADLNEALRWCVIVDDIPECDSDTAAIVHLDRHTGNVIIGALCGPAHDHNIAINMVARDMEAEQANAPARKTVAIEGNVPEPRQAANDNKTPAEKPSTFVDAQTLLGMEFEPIKYVIPGYVAEGLTLLGGRPKLGKSWLALDFGIAVASGGRSLGVECEAGDALYLALEDNQRRLQDRLRVVLPKIKSMRPDMSRLCLLTEAPKINAGLIDALEAWRKAVDNPRLIIIDTLAMVRPPKGRNQDSYAADYEALSPLQRYASEHRLAVVVVTHVRKAEAEDPLEMISGTNGLTGAADSIMILNRTADGPKLYGRGRDVEEVEKALKFDGGKWSVIGDADEVKRSGERRKILAVLSDTNGPMKPSEIAEAAGMRPANVSYLLRQMVKAGEAVKDGYGTYSYPPSSPSTPSSSDTLISNPPSSVEVDTDHDANLKDLEDLKGGTPSSDLTDDDIPAFLRKAA